MRSNLLFFKKTKMVGSNFLPCQTPVFKITIIIHERVKANNFPILGKLFAFNCQLRIMFQPIVRPKGSFL
ncbi:hypothetical protein Lpp78_03776 [Lacticaseibacillus paracasei subsp. paracasei CNCM I-2877]|nr:hypothetical protein Lpp78_03776 [Lacticaseibacillus paracasei subsp. paracasei CNCM I-2877]